MGWLCRDRLCISCSGHNTLTITGNPTLRYLGLRSLRTVKDGTVVIKDNARLCLANSVNWSSIVTRPNSTDIQADASSCSASPVFTDNMHIVYTDTLNTDGHTRPITCSAQCKPGVGCWGADDDDCVQCLQFLYDTRCVSTCRAEDG
jgi:hypothetical protein